MDLISIYFHFKLCFFSFPVLAGLFRKKETKTNFQVSQLSVMWAKSSHRIGPFTFFCDVIGSASYKRRILLRGCNPVSISASLLRHVPRPRGNKT